MGKGTSEEREAEFSSSLQWRDGKFHNPRPITTDNYWTSFKGLFSASDYGSPKEPVPVVKGDGSLFKTAPASGLRVTWFGHSSILLEIEDRRILIDPVWGERASPVTWMGPKRWYAPPVALANLPPLDAVVISHDHYDHLDRETIIALSERTAKFIVPLGVGEHLAYWGIPRAKIVERDWWGSVDLGSVRIEMTPARHASGRQVFDSNKKLWAGYTFTSARYRVYYSGDTGQDDTLYREIGDRLGPFDLTLIQVGAYGKGWPEWHLFPEEAVHAQGLLKGKLMLPVHWGLFNLAFHGWTEPVERLAVSAESAGIDIVVPRPGESVEPTVSKAWTRWWPAVPWERADGTMVNGEKK